MLIYGVKKPSREREQMILENIHRIGKEYMALLI